MERPLIPVSNAGGAGGMGGRGGGGATITFSNLLPKEYYTYTGCNLNYFSLEKLSFSLFCRESSLCRSTLTHPNNVLTWAAFYEPRRKFFEMYVHKGVCLSLSCFFSSMFVCICDAHSSFQNLTFLSWKQRKKVAAHLSYMK